MNEILIGSLIIVELFVFIVLVEKEMTRRGVGGNYAIRKRGQTGIEGIVSLLVFLAWPLMVCRWFYNLHLPTRLLRWLITER